MDKTPNLQLNKLTLEDLFYQEDENANLDIIDQKVGEIENRVEALEGTSLPALAPVATSGSYNDLSNKPSIPTVPTNVSAFANDSKYVFSQTITEIVALTQAEYDALPSTKTTDNKLYLIKG
jgi:hypothetical protein